jgi:hypothetical protein
MALKARIALSMFLLALALAFPGRGEEAPRPLEVNLPVKDYLALVEKAEAAEKERKRREAAREAPVAEVVSQRVRVTLGEKDVAEVTADYEVLVQGEPRGPVVLPVTGMPRKAEVRAPGLPDAALSAGSKPGEWLLVAPVPGRYAVQIAGPVVLSGAGVSRLDLAPAAAPVSLTEVEMPADLAWSAPGTVVVEDRVEGARRTVRLTSRRGAAQSMEIRRKVDGGDADRLLAQSLVLTLVQLLPDGPRRHDVVIYEVSRGGLGGFTVDLPPGLTAETVGTDEGEVVPVMESRRLTVQRRQQLRQVGYLVITSTPAPGAPGGELALDPVIPEGTVRARYAALSSSIAAEAHPVPEASWSRVDLDDLPPALRDALAGIDLSAAWRLSGPPAGTRMAVAPLPAAPVLPAVASLRETTTLLTLDGTLLHRDRIVLRPGAIGTALDLTLPASAALWSARVDEVAVRPLDRGHGTISVPLGFDTGRDAVIEVISVQEKAIPKGRSELALDLPRVAVPVQEHRWRLLLPDGASYRYRSGELRPAVERPAETGSGGGGGATGYGPGGSARLRGRVVDDQGTPLPGATLTLTGARLPNALIAVSDYQGYFVFIGLPGGDYSLDAEVEGFSSLSALRASGLGGDENRSIEVRMSSAVEDVITVSGEARRLDERAATVSAAELDKIPTARDNEAFGAEAKNLRKGLVGGVKPLPIAIPETGKLLLLSGVLPPEKIGVELEVRGKGPG